MNTESPTIHSQHRASARRGRLKASLRNSFFDGVFASCMTGLTTDYITPYALFLKAQAAHIGLLTAAPNLLSAIVQLKSPDLVETFRSRRRMINFFVFLHASVGIPIVLLPFIAANHAVVWLVALVTLFNGLNAVANPVWSSMLSDHVPAKLRGHYFGWRTRILSLVTICASFAAGVILHLNRRSPLKGFLIILSLAVISRFISWCFLVRMYDPPLHMSTGDYFTFFDFFRRIRESNFAKFVLFAASLNFSVFVASPFFSVFMLRDLAFDYITYMALVITVSLASIVMIKRWGRHADKVGNLRVMRFSSWLCALLPLLWVINQSPAYLFFVQFIGGFSWSGFNLCATNFIYDAVKPEKRARCIAYYNVCVGLGICAGSLCGGFLARLMPPVLGYRLIGLFICSAVLRLLAVGLILPKIREVRTVEHAGSVDLFYSIIGVRPLFKSGAGAQDAIEKEGP